MSRRKQPLPEYSSLIRWTVQEVINWLAENSLSDCTKCFRDGGVDGNKLANITETDLNNIRCPKKHIKSVMNYVSMVARPGQARTGRYGNRGVNQRQQPFHDVNHAQDDGSDDDGLWDDGEFSSGYDDDEFDSDQGSAGSAPKAPPRPNRRDAAARPAAPVPAPSQPRRPAPQPAPEPEELYLEPEESDAPEFRSRPPLSNISGRAPVPVPADSDSANEDYEDPDANMKVQNFHSGPLPKLPTEKNKPVPIGQRKPPPLPASSPQNSDSDSDIGEEYEDPDSTVAAKGPPIPAGPRRPLPPPVTSLPKTYHESPAEPCEDYEDPDVPIAAKPPQKSSNQRKPVPPPTSSVPTTHSMKKKKAPVVEEEYEDPDQTADTDHNKPIPPSVSKIPPRKPSHITELPAYEMPDEEKAPPPVPRNVPKRHERPIEPEETYEVPEETSPAPARNVPTPARNGPQRYNKNIPQHVEEETYEVPDTEETEEQDDYLEMDPDTVTPPNIHTPDYLDIEAENITPPKTQPPTPGGFKNKPNKNLRGKMPLPNESKSNSAKNIPQRMIPIEPQETYEIPEQEPAPVPQRKKLGVPVLPDLNDLKVSNGLKESSHSLHSQSGRALPPPPTASPERKESVKREPSKPSSTTNQHREMTEADLLRQKWYHGNIRRVDAEVKLKHWCIDGMYLIRKSSQGSDQPYTLQIFYKAKVYNLPIRRRPDHLFAVGKEEKENEKAFSSLLDLVNAFKQNILVLAGGAETKLVKSLPKKDPAV